MDWRILAVTVPALFVTYQSLVRFLPKGTSVFLVNAYASAVGLILMLLLHVLTQQHKSLQLTGRSLAIALSAGVLIGFGNFGIIKSFQLGAPQSSFTPLFYVSLITYGVLFGVIFFKDGFNLAQIGGAILAVSGIIIVFAFKN